MAKFRKKPVVIEATQWFEYGDNVHVKMSSQSAMPCSHCKKPLKEHGWIDTLEGGHTVCPGDWIITGVKGEMYPCKPDVFEQTYERVDA